MAEHMIETRILLRYDTYSRWMNSNVILKLGEAAVAAFPRDSVIEGLSNNRPENTPPAIGIKIGDGVHYFRELPWVQAVAADVYNWAKTSQKPTYTAQEIQGLQAFVETIAGIGGDVTIAPRIYQIVKGTEENEDKYYLQYKENNEEGEWIIDTSSYVDLSRLKQIYQWLGATNVEEYPSLIARTSEQIAYFLGTLNKEDNAAENSFVTSVSENKGIISVERARPTFANLSGIAMPEQGGTGHSSLTQDSVLVGNGTSPVRLIPIAEDLENNNYIVTGRVVKTYIDNATRGITGAMHFIGEATTTIINNSSVDPKIGGYDFSTAQPGDVILFDSKEFVWSGGNWRLLGDETSYVLKGSIKDSDIDPDAAIQQSKIANLYETLSTKVDKVDGKTLTSNDFTNDLKQKLNEIEEGAQVNKIEHIFLNDEEIRPTNVQGQDKSIDLQIKEFDDTSREKLGSIETGAQKNIIEKVVYDGEELTPDENKTVTITSNPHTEHENKIESIIINGVEQVPDKNKQVKIIIDDAALNLEVIKGARVPNGGSYEDVDITPDKKLELSRIAKTGNIEDIIQTAYSYITLDCGSSTDVIELG